MRERWKTHSRWLGIIKGKTDIIPLLTKMNDYMNKNRGVKVLYLCPDDWDDYVNCPNIIAAHGGKIWFTDKEVRCDNGRI